MVYFIELKFNTMEESELLTSPSHRHHGLRVVFSLQTKAFDRRQSGNDDIGLVGRAGPVVSI